MTKGYQPAIVVVAYSRPRSLERVLHSLQQGIYSEDTPLIISIDNNEPHNLNVKEIADQFKWPFGPKEVRYHEKHLGLRRHILMCGDLSEEYGSVIILEDDLYVSPYFYEYTVKALEYYSEDEKIGGVSLYNQPVQEIAQYPFSPVYDSSDVYFLQFPSSLGQAWSRVHWQEFRQWYAEEPDLSAIHIPDYIRNWPETSWKKYFCAFLVDKNKYFVFPRFSFTTNFNDPGTNLKRAVNHEGQTPLRLQGQPYRFKPISDSLSVYDVYLELMPECVNQWSSHLKEFDFELDLYGTKDIAHLKSQYVVTSRPSARPVLGFIRALKPHEMNVILNQSGNDLVLTRTEDIRPFPNPHERVLSNYRYFYTRYILGWKTQMNYYYTRMKQKFLKGG